jgi:PAS domain S-box-containing protein
MWQITLIDKKEQWNIFIIISYCLTLTILALLLYWLFIQAIKYYQIYFQNQESVKSLETWQQSILESVQSSVISTNLEGIITTFNSTASKMLGYDPNEVIGKVTPAIIHDLEEVIARAKVLSQELNLDITPGFNVFVVKAKKNGNDVNEWTYIHKNGTRFPVTLSVTPLYGHNKSLIGYLGVAQDLSAINIAKNKLKQIMQGIERGAIVASTDVMGKIIQVNEKFCEITGYAREELLGRDHRIINSKTHPPEFFKKMWQTISAGEVWSGEICNRNKNGEIYWVQTMITPLLNNNKEIESYLAIRIDITQKKRLEKTSYQQSQMLSLGEMAGGIAHEINNPLTIIQGMTTTLKTKINKNEIDETFFGDKLDKIYNSAQRIASIIKNMKALSQDSLKDETENIPVITIVENTISLCQEKFLHNKVSITIVNNIQQTKIQCHPSQISQALMNLLNNAYDVANISPHKWIKLYLEESNNTVTISVVDPGQGIADEITDKVMWPFFTTKEIGKATGLGLSTAKTLIESNSGTLTYQKRQTNTCFIVELPKNS